MNKKEITRKLQEIGKSLLVTLPASWLDEYGLRQKDNPMVKIISNDDGSLTVVPEDFKETTREITIEIYREVGREVVEKILSGMEKITLTSTTKIDPDIKKEIHFFLDRLPQAEIFEEDTHKIIIYNIGLRNIPNRKILHRLFNIIYELFQNIGENDEESIKQNIKELKKFYMILVGNIRTYHHTGKTDSEDADFSQAKASDYRLLAYQLKMIGKLLMQVKYDDRLTILHFENLKEYFNDIFTAFLKKDKNKAYKLWFENRELQKFSDEIIKLSDSVDWNASNFLTILEICRNMTALLSS